MKRNARGEIASFFVRVAGSPEPRVPTEKTRGFFMQIPIGQIIREELRRQGHTNEWLADRINVHPRTVQKIFCKSTIDTQQLLAISIALEVDFFQLYSSAIHTPKTGVMPVLGVNGIDN